MRVQARRRTQAPSLGAALACMAADSSPPFRRERLGDGKRAVARDAVRQQNPAANNDGMDSDSALLRALLQDGSVAFACYARDGRYRQVSRALAEINGLSVDEHLGRLPSEVLPGEYGAMVEESVARVVATGKSWREPE